jgi:hypothetical protein
MLCACNWCFIVSLCGLSYCSVLVLDLPNILHLPYALLSIISDKNTWFNFSSGELFKQRCWFINSTSGYYIVTICPRSSLMWVVLFHGKRKLLSLGNSSYVDCNLLAKLALQGNALCALYAWICGSDHLTFLCIPRYAEAQFCNIAVAIWCVNFM